MFFDFIINIFEAICFFLMIHILTWKYNQGSVLEKSFYKIRTIISLIIFISFNNTLQILTDLYLPLPYNKMIGLCILFVGVSIIFSLTYKSGKRFLSYMIASMFSMVVFLVGETIILGFSSMMGKDIYNVVNDHYSLMCIISIFIKFIALGIIVKINNPDFFKKLRNKQKDIGLTLLASTVTSVSRSSSRMASWFWFYNPKAPKCLSKDNK